MRKDAQHIVSTRRPGLPAIALACLAGDLAVQMLPSLPPTAWLLGVLFVALTSVLLAKRWPRLLLLALMAVAFGWSGWQAHQAMRSRLPVALAGRDVDAVGRIVGLPDTRAGIHRFRLHLERARLDGHAISLAGTLRLSWYGRPPSPLRPCARWRLRVRLKPPRALLDPGGFDASRHALEQGISAAGYVRDEGPNRVLSGPLHCVDTIRQALASAIDASVPDAHAAALLRALAVADRRGLDDQDWRLAREAGVSHLLAISGFHVGVAALLGGWLGALGWLLLGRRGPRQFWQAWTALGVAIVYALLAGMGLPVQRALVMIAVACLALANRRHVRAVDALAAALLAVLVLDPMAALSAGLWLSFAGVALLLLALRRARGLRARLLQLLQLQGLMSLALLPLGVWFFGQATLLGALVNLLAIPVVSLIVVPPTLAGCLLAWIAPGTAAVLWRLAAWPMQTLWQVLAGVIAGPVAPWYLPETGPAALLLAMLGMLWLLWPRGLPARGLGLLLCLPLLLPPTRLPQAGGFDATVLDVGQGLSVLVRTRHHAMVYDAGARFPSGFDLGQAVVTPALHAEGVHRLDLLMVSHGDNDHAGGAPAVARAWPGARLVGSEPARTHLPLALCRSGQHWRWDGVAFRVLHPDDAWPRGSNDGSCVLLISGPGGRLLLTGDISRLVEPDVARRVGAGAPLVLLVPHHGSNTSSGGAFIRALQPVMAVVSAGWHNRFGHPSDRVRARYAEAGIAFYNTADAGAVMIDFPPREAPRLRERLRCDRRHYWRMRACPNSPNAAGNAAIMSASVTRKPE